MLINVFLFRNIWVSFWMGSHSYPNIIVEGPTVSALLACAHSFRIVSNEQACSSIESSKLQSFVATFWEKWRSMLGP